MTVLSGKHGYVSVGSCLLAEFTEGNLEYGSEPQEYFSRSGGGAGQAVDGAESGRGSFTILINSESPASDNFSSGDLVTLAFVHTDSPSTIQATGQARLVKRNVTVNRNGVPQSETWAFVTNKAWTFPGE